MNITFIVSLTSANSVRRRFTFKVIRDKFKLSVVRLTPRFSNQSDNVGYCAFASQVIRFTRIFNNIAGVRVRILFLFVSLGFDPCKLIKTLTNCINRVNFSEKFKPIGHIFSPISIQFFYK